MLHVDDFYGRTLDIPEDRRYDPDRELWLQPGDGVRVRIGLTHAGVVLSGGIEALDALVAAGDRVEPGAALFEVEAFKASQDVAAPLGGTVARLNPEVIEDPELLDDACYGAAWLLELEPADPAAIDRFPDAAEYVAGLRASEHCATDEEGPGAPAGAEQAPAAAEALPAGSAREAVRTRYATLAASGCSCCGDEDAEAYVAALYEEDELASLPEGLRRMAMGCGNPVALARLAPGMRVVDLGSGGGIDAVLAALRVGPEGQVIGVDMTPEMLERARENAAEAGLTNVEFRLGDIEDLPIEDEWADAIISNCVINLSPRKDKVFSEAFRVLKEGGVLAVSDMVTRRPLPDAVRADPAAWSSCVSGAVPLEKYLALIERAGFMKPRVEDLAEYSAEQVAAFKEVDVGTFGEGSLSAEEVASLDGVLASARILTMKVRCEC